MPFLTEQRLGVGDQRVEMLLALCLGLVVGAVGLGQTGGASEHLRGRASQLVAVRDTHLGAHLAHVVALVTVGREGNALAAEFKVAQPARERQDVHLPAGVVHIVLTRHVPAGIGQQAGKAGAVGRTTAVADVQRAGRVGRDEFDLHLLLATQRRTTVSLALFENAAHDFELGRRLQVEVDEPRASDLATRDERRGGNLGKQQLSEFARVALLRACQLHRQVAREIAVRRLLRALERDGGVGLVGHDAEQRGAHQFGEVDFDVLTHEVRSAIRIRGKGPIIRRPPSPAGLRAVSRTTGRNSAPDGG